MDSQEIDLESALLKSWLQANFICKMCGNCCKDMDSIHINTEDVKRIARHYKIPVDKARRKYAQPHPSLIGELTLKQIDPCKFFDPIKNICKIYSVRPIICRSYPFLSGDNLNRNEIVRYSTCPGHRATLDAFRERWEGYKADPEIMQITDNLEIQPFQKKKVLTICLWKLGYYNDWNEESEKAIQQLILEMGPTLDKMQKALEAKVLANAAQRYITENCESEGNKSLQVPNSL